MTPKWLSLIALILGEAEQIVPIFIHNPKSKLIEGIVVTTMDHALETLSAQPATPPQPAAQKASA